MTINNGVMTLTGAIQLRGGTAADLASKNPLLAAREIMIETDTNKIKIGDGVTHWNGLNYATSASSGSGSSGTDTPTSGTTSETELPMDDNRIYVIKNGQYVSVTPELDEVADIELIQNEEMAEYQFTGTNIEVNV